MKKKSVGLGKIMYMEWLFPIHNYYKTLRLNEKVYEVIFPIIVATISVFLYSYFGKMGKALDSLSQILPSAISILIGFTAMLITILLTSSGENVNNLKKIETDVKLNKKLVTLYQKLHIQLTHALFNEIMLLLLIFFYLFVSGIFVDLVFQRVCLFFSVFLTLNILLSILRGITSIYFSFYNEKI